MIAWLARLAGGSATWWLAGIAGAAALAFVVTTQIVLHNRQAALEASEAAKQALAADLDEARQVNARNVETLDQLRADHARELADTRARLAQAATTAVELAKLRDRNAEDPDAAGALADRCPALDRLLDRLRETGAAPDRDPDRARRGPPP